MQSQAMRLLGTRGGGHGRRGGGQGEELIAEHGYDEWWTRCLDLDSKLQQLAADESLAVEADRLREADVAAPDGP